MIHAWFCGRSSEQEIATEGYVTAAVCSKSLKSGVFAI